MVTERTHSREILNVAVPYPAESTEFIFYDGHCGLCHRAVRFVAERDRDGSRFRFAPLLGETFKTRVPPDQQAGLSNNMVLQTAEGLLVSRSSAWIRILQRLGGVWKLIAALLSSIPTPLRDALYDFVASSRYHVFGRRFDVCPVASPNLRGRFAP
jgi:predicted DCC family thiol-disulfide oxidoreductase YuxK